MIRFVININLIKPMSDFFTSLILFLNSEYDIANEKEYLKQFINTK